jgi:hypothetical protein
MNPLAGQQFLELGEAELLAYASEAAAPVTIPGAYLAGVAENLRVLQVHGRIVAAALDAGETRSPPGAPSAFAP